MLRPERRGSFIVVEGSDDQYVFRQHADETVTILAGLGGKSDLLVASSKVDEHAISSVYFFVDRDYDNYLSTTIPYGRTVVASDGHDLVMDLVLSDQTIVRKVIESHARGQVAEGGAGIVASVIIEKALALAFSVGVLRLISVENNWGLNLRNYPFGKLSSDTPDDSELVQLALNWSAPSGLEGTIRSEHGRFVETYKDQKLSLVGDHDFFAAAAQVMRGFGCKSVSGENLTASFLAAFSCNTFTRSEWFDTLASLSSTDSGATCFGCPCEAA
ncbi:DUF4435 domain-containing protein [Williamsia maris]|nr:DUF4435 domain-containing protein [Williamsia maris]